MQVFAGIRVFSVDIDECQSLDTCANGICLNSEGSYTCENCPAGYRVSYDGELCEGESPPLLRLISCVPPHVFYMQPIKKRNAFIMVLAPSLPLFPAFAL